MAKQSICNFDDLNEIPIEMMVPGRVYYYDPDKLRVTNDGRLWITKHASVFRKKPSSFHRVCKREDGMFIIASVYRGDPVYSSSYDFLIPVCVDREAFPSKPARLGAGLFGIFKEKEE